MREKLLAFANEYAADMDNRGSDGDELRSINHPLVFLFLGDQTEEALRQVAALNGKQWNNSAGVVYLHVGTKPLDADDDRSLYRWTMPAAAGDKKSLRADLHKRFYQDEAKLLELNVILRKMNSRIAEFGRMYSHLQRLNIAVVTELDDPCNVLLPELTVLIKSVFGEHFRSVMIDLYGLLEEKQVEETYAFSSSLGVSFLRETDSYQDRGYRFEAMLQVTGEGIRLPVMHGPSPLFDMVYLLSNKDERGIFADSGMQGAYDIISGLNLLKNRKAQQELDPQHGAYNNQQFKQNMIPPDTDGRCYASAGMARVKRPDQAIALTALYHWYRLALQRLKENSASRDSRELLHELELEEGRSSRLAEELVSEPAKAVDGMYGMLYHPVSPSELKTMTLREAEIALFGGNAQTFFETNVARRAETALAQRGLPRELERRFRERVLNHPAYGFISGCAWTAETLEGGIAHELREQLRENAAHIEQCREELKRKYDERVEAQSFGQASLWSRLRNQLSVKQVVRHIVDEVYGMKLELLYLETKQQLLAGYIGKLEELHAYAAPFAERLRRLETALRDTSRSSISVTNDYLGRNINEFYEQVVKEIADELEERRGVQFYWEDRCLGNISALLLQGEEALIDRLIEAARKDLFSHRLFSRTFEDELLKRANVAASYDNREVLSKEDLFRDLYATLENEAAIRIDVYRSTHRHRYEEKYIFGDYQSEFVQYAYAVDHGSRTYKLGCIHEKKPSGIEKLNLMGGFRLDDLMYYRNGKIYYDTYVQNGYQFHGIELSGPEDRSSEPKALPDQD
ncbi:hypothetical protein SK3146_03025 [Paenibacillus konkukensis]|uniref:Transcription initiation factor TFIID n=1 Tax=Paenibacillus konkukensis TaxID=2020716 RepID=A0ABY4RQI3_9BACL|nr:hypothetical protein [Paenibacillus konkukensis]UQZ83818.1 hypothetical protein SK3146_03025 [Paenibacillus konkukensis]